MRPQGAADLGPDPRDSSASFGRRKEAEAALLTSCASGVTESAIAPGFPGGSARWSRCSTGRPSPSASRPLATITATLLFRDVLLLKKISQPDCRCRLWLRKAHPKTIRKVAIREIVQLSRDPEINRTVFLEDYGIRTAASWCTRSGSLAQQSGAGRRLGTSA